jgi:hypothetical protein
VGRNEKGGDCGEAAFVEKHDACNPACQKEGHLAATSACMVLFLRSTISLFISESPM